MWKSAVLTLLLLCSELASQGNSQPQDGKRGPLPPRELQPSSRRSPADPYYRSTPPPGAPQDPNGDWRPGNRQGEDNREDRRMPDGMFDPMKANSGGESAELPNRVDSPGERGTNMDDSYIPGSLSGKPYPRERGGAADGVPRDSVLLPANRNHAGAIGHIENEDVAEDTQKCHLHPWDSDIHERITRLVHEGTKLIEYQISFPEYGHDASSNPLLQNTTRNYKANVWYRATSSHGTTLLSLAFNYDALSLLLLSFGVEKLDVNVVDTPPSCFGGLSEVEKVQATRDLLMNDFRVHEKDTLWLDESDYICHQVIEDNDGHAQFDHECCTRTKSAGRTQCKRGVDDEYIDMLYYAIAAVKIALLFLGPLVLQQWIFREPMGKADYVLPLNPSDTLRKTMLVKKIRIFDDSCIPNPSQQKEIRQFKNFRQHVKSIPSEEIVRVTFRKLHVLIDQSKLMGEKHVPVGLFRFLYNGFLRCGICNIEPLASCCRESIVGSWSDRFLWIKLKKSSDCNRSLRKCLSWGHIVRFIGFLIILTIVPLPYYIRLACYYQYEEAEINDRQEAMDRLDLEPTWDSNLFQYLTPTHGGLIGIYVAYLASFLLLAALRNCDVDKFDNIARGAMEDMRNVSKLGCLRMLLAHLVLPFEKFGVCGVLVAAVYWPLALPFCVLAFLCYCIPTLYLTGRFLVYARPSCLHRRPFPASPDRRRVETLSYGASSFDTCLLLENISPSNKDWPASPNKRPAADTANCCSVTKQKCGSAFASVIVGVLCVVQMYALLIMYAESFGFLLEIAILTIMGAIVNAANAARYVMLVFWVVIYATSCYNRAYDKYASLNRKLFEFIKEKLSDQVDKFSIWREEEHRNTSFKFFTPTEVANLQKEINFHTAADDNSAVVRKKEAEGRQRADEVTRGTARAASESADRIEYDEGKLHWCIYSMIFFVDKRDVPRIPRKLFRRVCELEAPGCPGPIHKSMLAATKHLLCMVVFMVFVFIVIMALGNIGDVSTTSQLLMTVAGGFLPFLIRFVLQPKQEDVDLNSYSFKGKVYQLIKTFNQSWPVFDLSFTRDYPLDSPLRLTAASRGAQGGGGRDHPPPPPPQTAAADGAEAVPGQRRRYLPETVEQNAPDLVDPTHVDLLITIRDESRDDLLPASNRRPDPGSLGSHGSLTSANKNSPDDQGNNPPPYGGGAYGVSGPNNPTNATHMATQTSGLMPSSLADSQMTVSVVGRRPSPSPGAGSGAGSQTTQPLQSSAGMHTRSPHMDLVVDLTKGGVHVRSENGAQSENAKNGIPMWPMASAYNRMVDPDSESAL